MEREVNMEEEQKGRLHEEIIFRTTIQEQMQTNRNVCAHDILEVLEYIVGKDHPKWIEIRKAVLDKINDYHRSVCDIMERIA